MTHHASLAPGWDSGGHVLKRSWLRKDANKGVCAEASPLLSCVSPLPLPPFVSPSVSSILVIPVHLYGYLIRTDSMVL